MVRPTHFVLTVNALNRGALDRICALYGFPPSHAAYLAAIEIALKFADTAEIEPMPDDPPVELEKTGPATVNIQKIRKSRIMMNDTETTTMQTIRRVCERIHIDPDARGAAAAVINFALRLFVYGGTGAHLL